MGWAPVLCTVTVFGLILAPLIPTLSHVHRPSTVHPSTCTMSQDENHRKLHVMFTNFNVYLLILYLMSSMSLYDTVCKFQHQD